MMISPEHWEYWADQEARDEADGEQVRLWYDNEVSDDLNELFFDGCKPEQADAES